MSTKIIIGIMLLALVAIRLFAPGNDIAGVLVVLAIAAFAYATTRKRRVATKNPAK